MVANWSLWTQPSFLAGCNGSSKGELERSDGQQPWTTSDEERSSSSVGEEEATINVNLKKKKPSRS